MSRFIISVKLQEFKEKFYKNSFFSYYRINTKGWLIVFLGLIFTCGLLYLSQVNSLATKGYKIKDLEEKVSELRDKNKKLELDITQLRSTDRINNSIQQLKMVAVARIEYLKPDGTSVALNR